MAPRPAGRASARQIAAYRSSIAKNFAKEIERDIRRKIAQGIQEFAVTSMNNLAKAGPAWTGEFSQSWVFLAEGETGLSFTAGSRIGIGRYNKNDVPLFEIERDLKARRFKFAIKNISDHALIATDEEESVFYPPEHQRFPFKDPVAYGGGRPPDDLVFRYQMKEVDLDDPEDTVMSRITAPQDWFATYLNGGGLQRDLSAGFSVAFK